ESRCDGPRRLSQGRHSGRSDYARPQPPDSARTRNRSTVGGGKEHQGSRGCFGIECEDGRNASLEYYAETATAFGERLGPVRSQEQHRSCGASGNRVTVSARKKLTAAPYRRLPYVLMFGTLTPHVVCRGVQRTNCGPGMAWSPVLRLLPPPRAGQLP